jgi:hypothetical protein
MNLDMMMWCCDPGHWSCWGQAPEECNAGDRSPELATPTGRGVVAPVDRGGLDVVPRPGDRLSALRLETPERGPPSLLNSRRPALEACPRRFNPLLFTRGAQPSSLAYPGTIGGSATPTVAFKVGRLAPEPEHDTRAGANASPLTASRDGLTEPVVAVEEPPGLGLRGIPPAPAPPADCLNARAPGPAALPGSCCSAGRQIPRLNASGRCGSRARRDCGIATAPFPAYGGEG